METHTLLTNIPLFAGKEKTWDEDEIEEDDDKEDDDTEPEDDGFDTSGD